MRACAVSGPGADKSRNAIVKPYRFSSVDPYAEMMPSYLEDYLLDLWWWEQSLPAGCLAGATFLVTGATYMTIGGAAAYGLAAHCGVNVICHVESDAAKQRMQTFLDAKGVRNVTLLVADFRDMKSVENLAEVVRGMGPLRGILDAAGLTESMDIANFEYNKLLDLFHVNFAAAAVLCRELLPTMVSPVRPLHERPAMVFFSSGHARVVCNAGNFAYAMTKCGQERLALDIARSYAGQITATAIQFGWIDNLRHRSDEQVFRMMVEAAQSNLARCVATPSEAALECVQACLPSSRYKSGEIITFAGGRFSLWPG